MPGYRYGKRPPPWWPHNESWPPRGGPEARAWARFGRRMARLAVLWSLVVIVTPLIVGVVLATRVGGAASVVVALISWIGLAALVAIVLRFAFRSWSPVRSLIDTAGRLADGDYQARVRPTSWAPLRSVVQSFNRMAERLEDAETGRRRLLADVGHELRTPLTIVRGELEAMADGVHQLDADALRRLLDDLAVMERLLDDLQTLSTAEAGTLKIHPEPTDLAALAEDVLDRFQAGARGAGVDLRVVHDADRGPVDAEVDPVRLREILANLVGNAMRATPAGGTVTVGFPPPDDPQTTLLTVCDNGAGIAPDELPHVFDRFHRGPESDGSGLGLTITRNLVEAHGGSIEIASEPGRGTTVRVVLPNGD